MHLVGIFESIVSMHIIGKNRCAYLLRVALCESDLHLFCLIDGQVVQGDGHNTVLVHGSGFL